MLDILVIAPHPDDAELGMGGAILKFKNEGRRVGMLDLTSGEPTPHGTPEIRKRETAAATAILGIEWRENLGLPNRSLEATIENRAKLAGVIRRETPRWLFAPYWIDAHPDHVAATRTRRRGPLLVEAHQDRPAGRAASSAADLQLLLRPFEAWRRSRRSCSTSATNGNRSWRPSAATKASSSPAGRPSRRRSIDALRDEAAYWGKTIGVALRRAVYLPRADRAEKWMGGI